ncbi:MAG TPA: hypothetical protein ENJ45_03800 [Phaeodactylibacter sp.]|nr:hypothetical protein [Phaeodactylibacter sp.]
MRIIKGKVVYKNIGPGFWAIVDTRGGEWRPINLPEQLKQEGRKVTLMAKEVEEDFSVFMWGKAIRVLGFNT